jgi:plastocyanin
MFVRAMSISGVGARCALWLMLAAVATARAIAADAPSITGRVTGADGKGIAEAVVFVQSPMADGSFGGTKPMATMDQIEKTFVPGLLPIVVGTNVRFPNHDQIHHHVYSFSRTKTFELPLYKGEDAPPVLFDKVGVVKVGCNIHDWMSSIILVLPSPYFAQTDTEGRFTLEGLPHGKYSLVAWHELSKAKPEETAQPVTVSANTAEVNFTLTLGAARARPAVRGSRREP